MNEIDNNPVDIAVTNMVSDDINSIVDIETKMQYLHPVKFAKYFYTRPKVK